MDFKRWAQMNPVKSLFLTASILLTPVLARAVDVVSTGTIKFVIIATSTRYTDAKGWFGRNNDNWQAAATALSNQNSIISAIATDTTTLLSVIKSTAVQLSNH